jgi:hypothetical protein
MKSQDRTGKPKTASAPEIRVEVRLAEHPVDAHERLLRLRRLGQRLEAIRLRVARERVAQ